MFFVTTGWSRDGRRGARTLAEDLRSALVERFPAAVAVELEEGYDRPVPLESSLYTITVPGNELGADAAEGAKRALSSIVEDVVRAHGLRTDTRSLVYYAGRRVGVGANERDFALSATIESNATFRIAVTRYSAELEALQRAVEQDLAARLDAEFGRANVERGGSAR